MSAQPPQTEETTKPKNIVLCSDGTGNTAIKNRGTNVFKLYEAVDLNGYKSNEKDGTNLPRQVAFYDDGVGTQKIKPIQAISGALGLGLKKNVLELYADLCRSYHPGDRIYVFGFSRGAFTARTVAGLIVGNGIIKPEKWEGEPDPEAALKRIAREAWKAHRQSYSAWIDRLRPGRKDGEKVLEEFRSKYAWKGDCGEVEFIGVWDTVDAYGLPFDFLTKFINKVIYRFSFPNTRLHENVKKACHAVALDDERHTFHPVMWDERIEEGEDLQLPAEEGEKPRIEQVWFAGAHSNVGGGYPKQGLSLVTLDWMMEKATDAGLEFLPGVRSNYRAQRNVDDKLYDSRAGGAIFYRYKPRRIQDACRIKDEKTGVTVPSAVPRVHVSVFERIWHGTADYAPGPMPEGLRVVSTHGERNRGEERFSLEKIAEIVTAEGAPDAVEGWVWVRRLTHAVLCLTAAIIGFLAWQGLKQRMATAPEAEASEGVGFLLAFVQEIWHLAASGVGGLFSLLGQVLHEPALWIPLVVVLGIVWALSRTAKQRIQGAASRFWRGLMAKTRSANSAAEALAKRLNRSG
jgi:uncharacterized protein (DUF2235 family)